MQCGAALLLFFNVNGLVRDVTSRGGRLLVRPTKSALARFYIGRAEPNQQYLVWYPAGKYREKYRDPDTGEERYAT